MITAPTLDSMPEPETARPRPAPTYLASEKKLDSIPCVEFDRALFALSLSAPLGGQGVASVPRISRVGGDSTRFLS